MRGRGTSRKRRPSFCAAEGYPSVHPSQAGGRVPSPAQLALGGWHLILRMGVDRNGSPESARKSLETGLRYMMIVDPVKGLDVERDAGVHGKGPEPLADQLSVERPDFVTVERGPENK